MFSHRKYDGSSDVSIDVTAYYQMDNNASNPIPPSLSDLVALVKEKEYNNRKIEALAHRLGVKVRWINPNDENRGYEIVQLIDGDYEKLSIINGEGSGRCCDNNNNNNKRCCCCSIM